MNRRNLLIVSLAAMVLAVAPTALADKGGNGGGKGHPAANSTATGSFDVVPVDSNGNGVLNWGESVTFDVSTNAPYPLIALSCTNGSWTSTQTIGYYIGWPTWDRVFSLKSWIWTGGAAECSAELYSVNVDGTNRT